LKSFQSIQKKKQRYFFSNRKKNFENAFFGLEMTPKNAQTQKKMLSKREVVTEWLLRGPVPLPELCDLVCQYMLMFEGSSSQILWGFPPSMIQPEVSLLDDDRVALFHSSTLEVREMYTGNVLWTCVGHTKTISAVVDLGQGLIASSEFGGMVRVWRQNVCVREIPCANLQDHCSSRRPPRILHAQFTR
jgi:hypothetical protein